MAHSAPSTTAEIAQRRRHRLLLSLILVVSAFLQLSVAGRSETLIPIRSDAKLYFSYAWNLRHFGTYSSVETWHGPTAVSPAPDKAVPPGFPVLLAAIPDIAPDGHYVLRVSFVQALLGVASVWLAYLLAASFLGEGWALGAAALTAISPHLATINTYLLTESLFTFFLLASLCAVVRASHSPGWKRWALAGVLWGVCSLVRPTMQFLPPLFLVAAVVLPKLRGYRPAAGAMLVAFLLVQAPWWLRNLSVPDLASSATVSFLHHGSYPDFEYAGRPETFGSPYDFDPDNERVTRDVASVLRDIAGNFRAQPLVYARWYLVGKPLQFVAWDLTAGGFADIYTYPPLRSPYLTDVRFRSIRSLMHVLHWPLMLLGFFGAAAAAWRPRAFGIPEAGTVPARLLGSALAYAIALHMIGAPYPRYSIPFRPLFYMFALLPVSAAIAKARRARESVGQPASVTT